MRRLAAILCALCVPGTAWLYYGFESPRWGAWGAQWASYAADHLVIVVLAVIVAAGFARGTGWPQWVGFGSCVWIALEALQASLCGALSLGQPNYPWTRQLCVERFGIAPYMVLFAVAVATLAVVALRREKQ